MSRRASAGCVAAHTRSMRGPLALVVMGILSVAAPATAANCEWTGGGVDAKWSRPANWVLCRDGVPQNGDTVIFAPGRPRATSENDLALLTLANVALNGTSSDGGSQRWRVTGAGVRLTGTLRASALADGNGLGPAFEAPIILAGDASVVNVTAGAAPFAVGPIELDGFALRVEADQPVSVAFVLGAGSITKAGVGTLTLGDSAYTGPTICTDGTLVIAAAHALGAAGPGNETRTSGECVVRAAATVTIDEAFTFEGIPGVPTVNTSPGVVATFAGSISAPTTAVLFDIGTAAVVHVSGAVTSGPVEIRKVGSGALVLSNPANAFPRLVAARGTVRVGAAGAIPDAADVSLQNDAVFDLNDVNETIGGLQGTPNARVLLGAGTLTVNVAPTSPFFAYAGTIAGTGGIVKRGGGNQAIASLIPNTYTGPTTVDAGSLVIGGPNGVDVVVGPIVINGGRLEALCDCLSDAVPVTVGAQGTLDVDNVTIGSLAGAGRVIGRLHIGANNTSTTFSGVLETRGWTKLGAGTLTFTGTSDDAFETRVEGGTLVVDGSLDARTVVRMGSATLGGSGHVGVILPDDGANGVVSPGAGTGTAVLRAAAVSLRGMTLAVQLNGLAAGTGYDRLEVVDGALLSLETRLARLVVTRGFGPQAGNAFVILAVADGPVVGTFDGLPEGAALTVDGQRFRISYRGGDGNDVVLTALEGPPVVTSYLAEGATSGVFDTELALMNPGELETTAHVAFFRSGLAPATIDVAVPAHRRATLDPKTVLGAGTSEFSTTVTSSERLVVDRTLHWAHGEAYGAHAETAVTSPGLTWYLAEGATHSGLNLFYLLQNPNVDAAEVRVRYLRPSGGPIEKTYTLPPQSRTNIWVNVEDFPGVGAALASTDVSAAIEVLNGQPIIVERALYAPVPGQILGAGHDSAGVTAPALEWFLAEGATGSFMDLFVLIANPNDTAAEVEATYFLPDGSTVVKAYAVAPNSRFSVWVDQDDARLADTAVSTRVRSTNGVPVIVERAMWWPDGNWYEGHNSPGSTTTGAVWGLAAGALDAARGMETFILVANPADTTATVRVSLYFEEGAPAERTFEVLPRSRFNVAVAAEFPQAAGRRFGAVVESLGDVPASIVVERSMYWDATGQLWAAGTNALGVKLR